ncbi:hypothetical protein LU699_10735 [Luteimonas fraxinea]|uniref:DUF2919 family protein n=1 Tax=Luteimonas fraxinea TaxID=2901869 RepID=A0ABS8UG95_9GAMM|nr:hypothetical protein [Luteimonas fraxinea]MCD9098274.1 hypothetical protein [Luteimonas fraxinea]MCD9127006.1 hypothetical protein [Luteimonas fraxinea]UHH08788.1 hypothetical protein LU699_10735 [Luteimonas fraxinea]
MTHLVHLRRAVGWLLVALLATVVLVNLIGFFSPFWGHWRHPGDASQSRALLNALAPWTAVLSLLFLLPAWHLSRTLASPLARGVVLVMGALVVVADVMALLSAQASDDPVIAQLVSSLTAGYPFVAFLVFIWLVWRALRIEAPRHNTPGEI